MRNWTFLCWCVLIIVCLLLLVSEIVSQELGIEQISTNSSEFRDERVILQKRKECRQMRKRFRVKPGTSWGSLSTKQQDYWMKLGCDQFFCEPNNLAGRGVYRCIPLQGSKNFDSVE